MRGDDLSTEQRGEVRRLVGQGLFAMRVLKLGHPAASSRLFLFLFLCSSDAQAFSARELSREPPAFLSGPALEEPPRQCVRNRGGSGSV